MESNTRSRTGLYFVGPIVDASVIGGASILAYIALRAYQDRIPMETIYAMSAAMLIVVNWPHFSATVYRLYHSQSNIRQYPLTAILVPFVLLGGVWASFAEPDLVAPYFVKLYLIWSPYHFSGQSLGITLLYARRANVRFSNAERFLFGAFIYGTFLLPLVRFETGRVGGEYYGVAYPTLGLPSWTPRVAEIWLAAGAVALVLVFARWKRDGKTLPPAIVFLPAITQCVWFILGARVRAYNEFVPMFHSLQYLFIAWALQLKEKLELDAIRPSRRYVVWESVRWLLLNIVGGMLLFETLPLIFGITGHSSAFVTGIIFSAVQIHHFFVDGVIWKLKSPTVSSPLMVNFSDLLGMRTGEPVGMTASTPARAER